MGLTPTGRDTVGEVLMRGALTRAGAPFLVFDDDGRVLERTYEAMWERARRTAGALSQLGVGAGDRVCVHLRNCPEFFDCWFGIALRGAVLVPTNPLLAAPELAYEVEHSDCRVIVTHPDLAPETRAAAPRAHVVETGADFDTRLDLARPLDAAPVEARAPAAVLYTSGTTSRPKGVVVTHANYLHAGEVVAGHLRVRAEDRWLVVLPLFHANAQYYSTMSALVSGASVAVTSRFSASNWGAQATRHRATLASLFAAPIRMILAADPSPSDADNSLRAVIFSQNVTDDQLASFEKRFGAPLLQLYGMTETIAPPALNPLHGRRRNMTIGRATLGARLRIVDGEGEDVPIGAPGELLVAGEPGSTLMAGYLDDPDGTAAALRDGWLHTGDTVVADDEGYLTFVDRAKDMIKRAGENVAAGEVEAVLDGHPGVYECAVIGVPDAMRDEAIHALVVRAEASVSEEDLIAWCRARLARFKVPGSIEFVDNLPRTPVGKVQKELLRQRARATGQPGGCM